MILKFWYKSSNNISLLLVDKPVEMELIKNVWKSNVSTLEWVRRYELKRTQSRMGYVCKN